MIISIVLWLIGGSVLIWALLLNTLAIAWTFNKVKSYLGFGGTPTNGSEPVKKSINRFD